MATLKIDTAEFLLGATDITQLPSRGMPEIALAGRSNVGKSSLLNKLTGRRQLARISRTPGKTRELNLYEINGRMIIVDLPGYGFARVPDGVREAWGRLIESYLTSRKELRAIVHLVDARHDPSGDDIQMHEWIRHYRVPALIAVTKVDKIARGKRAAALRSVAELLEPDGNTPVVFFSAETGEGSREIWGWIQEAIGLRG
ncbi:MAG: YihA family ribosome biogenesis GTP-binding protein [Candidatus Eisenbacteria bacterium]|nr:YihA family ribosome biogenesis GTP-binding protein [Candidatus Eisenbacteria bacterium]